MRTPKGRPVSVDDAPTRKENKKAPSVFESKEDGDVLSARENREEGERLGSSDTSRGGIYEALGELKRHIKYTGNLFGQRDAMNKLLWDGNSEIADSLQNHTKSTNSMEKGESKHDKGNLEVYLEASIATAMLLFETCLVIFFLGDWLVPIAYMY